MHCKYYFMEKKTEKPKAHFRTNVLLKSILGKDLINNDNVAVLELIKNSFDAGSITSEVVFKNILINDDLKSKSYSNRSSKIIIKDQGKGMSKEDVEDKWLNIAYSEKKKQKEIDGRALAGNKGVGRFSCDRLGEYLDIYSRKKGQEIVHLKIDWKKFEFDDDLTDTKEIEIQDIEIYVKNISEEALKKTGHTLSKTGTIIEISRLRSIWNEEKLKKLRHYLERLLNPNQSFDKTRFSIKITAAEFGDDVNGIIKNQIFEKLEFTTTSIESYISKDGKDIITSLKDKGKDVFTILERNQYSTLKDIKIVLYFLNTYAKIYFAKKTGTRSVRFGSVFLFKNGFRISPYGDEDNDWLKLEIRKGQGVRRFLGTRDVVGRIEINDLEGEFKEVSSREGLIENENFKLLTSNKKGYFIDTFKRLERYVVNGLDWDRVPVHILDQVNDKEFQKKLSQNKEEYIKSQEEKNKSILESINSIIRANPENTIELFINADLIASMITEEQGKANKIIEDFEKFGESKINVKTYNAIINVKEKLIKEKEEELRRAKKRISRLKTSLKQVASQNLFYQSRINIDVKELISYHHQIGISAGAIDNYLIVLNNKIKKGKTISNTDLEKYIKSISFELNKINTVVNFATKANFNDASELMKGDLVQFITEYIENVVQEVVKTIDHKSLKIKIINNTIGPFKTSFIPMEMMIVIDNLIKNSSKAEATEIVVELDSEEKDVFEFSIRDNGLGMSNRILDKIFEFGFTTTDGSGLGLFHVKSIIDKMKGDVVVNNKIDKGVEFKIILSK